MSPSTTARNSSPGPPPGLTAIALSFWRTPSSASARRNSASSLPAMGGGVSPRTKAPPPQSDVDLRQSDLGHARNVRQLGRANRTSYCKGADLAAQHERNRGRAIGNGEQCLSARYAEHHLVAALIGNGLRRHAGLELEELGRDGECGRRGGVVGTLRICLSPGNKVLDCFYGVF